MSFATVNQLLRQPAQVAERCHADDNLREIALTSLVCIGLGAAIFGGVLGAQRGGLQVLYSGVKLPAALLLTLCLAAPAFHSMVGALGRPWPIRATVTLVLSALARFALVLMAVAPFAWLLIDAGIGYHGAVLVAVGCYGVSFLAALFVLGHGLGQAPGRALALIGFSCVLLGIGAQAAWALRPFLGRPSQETVPFVRAPEGGFADAVVTSGQSAAGIYRRVETTAEWIDQEGRRRPASDADWGGKR